jgi:hypothetical protein
MKTQSLFDDNEDILEVLVSGTWQETNEDFFFNDCWLPRRINSETWCLGFGRDSDDWRQIHGFKDGKYTKIAGKKREKTL